jgi:hypothetical protein
MHAGLARKCTDQMRRNEIAQLPQNSELRCGWIGSKRASNSTAGETGGFPATGYCRALGIQTGSTGIVYELALTVLSALGFRTF